MLSTISLLLFCTKLKNDILFDQMLDVDGVPEGGGSFSLSAGLE